MNILVVDDSSAMRMMIIRALRQAGAGNDVDQAEDGQIALECIRDKRPNLVLADWNMPNMTGMELLEAINRENINVKFGFITTESSTEMRQKATEAGARFLIAKPFTVESFEKMLASL